MTTPSHKNIFIHPSALVDDSACLGEGSRVWAFSHIMKGARLGSHCNIGEHCFIEGGVQLGSRVTIKNGISIWSKAVIEDGVFLGPSVVLTNDKNPRAFLKKGESGWLPLIIRKGATIGAGAVLLPGIEIGAYAFVAAGAVVTRSVPAHGVVRGNPARHVGWTCICAQKIVPLPHMEAPRVEGFRCPHCPEEGLFS